MSLERDCEMNCPRCWFAYNPDHITVFKLAHEMIHAQYGDERCNDNDVLNPCEIRANHQAIVWLWNEYLSNGGSRDYFSHFIEITGCPFDETAEVVREMA
jgi:hypothetical protein